MDSFTLMEARIRAVATRLPGGPPVRSQILSRLLVHVHQRFETALQQALAPHGLGIHAWSALMLMYSDPHDELNPCVLSALTNLSRTNVTRLMDDLVARGWVRRRPAEADRRRVLLSLTARGIPFVESVLPDVRALYSAIWDGFDDAELVHYERLSRGLLARLDAFEADAVQPGETP